MGSSLWATAYGAVPGALAVLGAIVITFQQTRMRLMPGGADKAPRRLADYERVHYLLVARDHWLWVEPTDEVAIVEFEAFAASLSRSPNLQSVIDDLLTYDWLPVERRDFRVQYDRATANGVSIESQVFYAI